MCLTKTKKINRKPSYLLTRALVFYHPLTLAGALTFVNIDYVLEKIFLDYFVEKRNKFDNSIVISLKTG